LRRLVYSFDEHAHPGKRLLQTLAAGLSRHAHFVVCALSWSPDLSGKTLCDLYSRSRPRARGACDVRRGQFDNPRLERERADLHTGRLAILHLERRISQHDRLRLGSFAPVAFASICALCGGGKRSAGAAAHGVVWRELFSLAGRARFWSWASLSRF